MQERAELARYAHLPLGAVGGDWRTASADALFARMLRDANNLLWVFAAIEFTCYYLQASMGFMCVRTCR